MNHQKTSSAENGAGGVERAERPILFSAPMVRAILSGGKTQTRRVISQQPLPPMTLTAVDVDSVKGKTYAQFDMRRVAENHWCPFGKPGDRLWVRETHAWLDRHIDGVEREDPVLVGYPSDDSVWRFEPDGFPLEFDRLSNFGNVTPRPSIFMPRWASRITLDITNVRVERLQEISEHDARAEGIEGGEDAENWGKFCYRKLWNSLNEKRGFAWESNPWVWVLEFEMVGGRRRQGCETASPVVAKTSAKLTSGTGQSAV